MLEWLLPWLTCTVLARQVQRKIFLYWRGVRVVDGDALEMRFGESQRGFESPPLR
jgi:hypothetical protein